MQCMSSPSHLHHWHWHCMYKHAALLNLSRGRKDKIIGGTNDSSICYSCNINQESSHRYAVAELPPLLAIPIKAVFLFPSFQPSRSIIVNIPPTTSSSLSSPPCSLCCLSIGCYRYPPPSFKLWKTSPSHSLPKILIPIPVSVVLELKFDLKRRLALFLNRTQTFKKPKNPQLNNLSM